MVRLPCLDSLFFKFIVRNEYSFYTFAPQRFMEYFSHQFDNGIRFVHIHSKRYVAHLGVLINAGTRDENALEHGMAHFIEHTIFKGTEKRKAYHILSRMEDVGGEIDAYTTKEETVVTCSFLKRYYQRAAELLSDIIIRSTFPEKELIKEKEVISEEILSYQDSPAEQIYDDFENWVFQNHDLGHPILGDQDSLYRFKKEDVTNFIKRTHNTDQIIICSIGDISNEKALATIETFFGGMKPNLRTWKRNTFKGYQPFEKIHSTRTHQAHCLLGNIAYGAFHEKRKVLLLLNNILGGPGLNSRLNLSLREKHGWVYNIESNYAQYSDVGLWSVYFGTDKDNFEKVLKKVKQELKQMQEFKLGPLQLTKAKNQIIGQMAMASENNQDMLAGIAKSYMMYHKIESFESIKQTVQDISADAIREVANEVFNPDQLSVLAFV